ncbi:hypothetical protein FOCC_FOCC003909 [Frankliniella occidentalis]|nr:hypothetical protein FOCC_FOCC003909 [Frankliniella occidentalis]
MLATRHLLLLAAGLIWCGGSDARVTGYSLKITRGEEDRTSARGIVTFTEMLRKENRTNFTPKDDGEEIANLFLLDYTESNIESLLVINVEVEILLWDNMSGS